MGIYEHKTKSDPIAWAHGYTWWEISDPGYGQTRRRLIIANNWQDDPRTNCFCCTCSYDPEYGDITVTSPMCRNHGWTGTRPCIKHQMKGDEAWESYIR